MYRWPGFGDSTIFYCLDEFQGATDLAELNGMMDPEAMPGGFKYRRQANTGHSAHGSAHAEARFVLTANFTVAELEALYMRKGHTQAQWRAFLERVVVVDQWALGEGTIPRAQRRARDPARVAATLAGMVRTAASGLQALPFARVRRPPQPSARRQSLGDEDGPRPKRRLSV
jgi:hypothetical protein